MVDYFQVQASSTLMLYHFIYIIILFRLNFNLPFYLYVPNLLSNNHQYLHLLLNASTLTYASTLADRRLK